MLTEEDNQFAHLTEEKLTNWNQKENEWTTHLFPENMAVPNHSSTTYRYKKVKKTKKSKNKTTGKFDHLLPMKFKGRLNKEDITKLKDLREIISKEEDTKFEEARK
jgi:hypothetical protein